MKETKNIGILSGKVLVFGGSYSNLQSLQAMKKIADDLSISGSNIICTGDIMGYCSQPNECIELIDQWGIHSIAGNVELQVRNNEEDCGCNFEDGSRCDVFARSWYPYIQANIKPENKEWLQSLPEFISFEYAGKKGTVIHGGIEDTSQFIFESTDWSIKEQIFAEANADLLLTGHCGLPFHSIQDEKFWLNPGVIGMPANDGTTRVWYMILDGSANDIAFQHYSFQYDNATAASLIKKNKLPFSYAHTLSNGLWDNNDILPAYETSYQGVEIDFTKPKPSIKKEPTNNKKMKDSYYKKDDLKQFGKVTDWQKEMGDDFFKYYEGVFKEGALTTREKALIALAVSHAVHCPYCIDAYTSDCLNMGVEEQEMMEAVHVASAISSGTVLIHGVQMMNQVKDKLM